MITEIVYADANGVHICRHEAAAGSSAGRIIEQSGVLEQFPEIDLARNRIGMYGKLIDLDTPVEAGDRIEIYVPVQADPKQARRNRAQNRGK
ncbi:MAG: RnfH family protein [Gammaproteobacteria bacterium]